MTKIDEKEKQTLEFDYKKFKLIDMYSDYGDITGIQTIKRFIQHVNKHFGKMNESIIEFIRLYTDLTEIQDSFTAFITAWNQMVETHETFLAEVRQILEDWIEDPRVQIWIVERLDLMIANELTQKLDKQTFNSFVLDYNSFVSSTNNKILDINNSLATKADTTFLTTELNKKTDVTSFNSYKLNDFKQKEVDIARYGNMEVPSGSKGFAHRGMSYGAPENTTVAFIRAGMHGAYGIEFDMQVTKDGWIVILHNETVDYMTNGVGRVNDMTLAQIQALNIDEGFDIANFTGLKIPTLDEVLHIANRYGLVPMAELKANWRQEDYIYMLSLFEKYGLLYKSYFISFPALPLNHLRAINPDIMLTQLTGSAVTQQDIDDAVALKRCGISMNYLNNTHLSNDFKKQMKQKNVPYGFWTVNDASVAKELSEQGADFIVSSYGFGGRMKRGFRQGIIQLSSSGITRYGTGAGSYARMDSVTVEKLSSELKITYLDPFEDDILNPVTIGVNVGGGQNIQDFSIHSRSQTSAGFIIYAVDTKTGAYIHFDTLMSRLTGIVYISFTAHGLDSY